MKAHAGQLHLHVALTLTLYDHRGFKQIGVDSPHARDEVFVMHAGDGIAAAGIDLNAGKTDVLQGCTQNRAQLLVFFKATTRDGDTHGCRKVVHGEEEVEVGDGFERTSLVIPCPLAYHIGPVFNHRWLRPDVPKSLNSTDDHTVFNVVEKLLRIHDGHAIGLRQLELLARLLAADYVGRSWSHGT